MSSISYSTFISEPKISRPALDDKPISFSEGPCSHGNSQKQSYLSGAPTRTSMSIASTDELNRPLSAGAHPPFCMELVSQPNSSMYDTPKKVTSQSLEAASLWRSFADYQLNSGGKMKPTAVPCITPSHQSLTPPANRPATHDVESMSVRSHDDTISIESETTYDIPRKVTPLHERDKCPQMPKYAPVAFGPVSSECDSRNSTLILVPTASCTNERTKPLSEMIKSHPLLKHQQVEHFSYENTPLQHTSTCGFTPSPCSGCKTAHAIPLKNDQILSSQGEMQPTVHNNIHQQGCLSTDTSLESSNQSHVTHSPYEGQTIEYSQVISASMNRAQTLIARNIQELKQLDCEQVFLCPWQGLFWGGGGGGGGYQPPPPSAIGFFYIYILCGIAPPWILYLPLLSEILK